MSLLSDRKWNVKYTPDDGDLLKLLYLPALDCATRYDRLTGYFQAKALTLAARGIENLVRNSGRMRLLVGCTLDQAEVEAIGKGTEWRQQVKAHLLANPLKPVNQHEVDALELLAWMVANQFLEVKVAVPCDQHRRPIPAAGIFHEKAGIIEDKTGDRLAFNGSLNETEAGWQRNWESLNVFLSWFGDERRVAAEETNFAKLWSGESKHVVTLDVPDAVKDDLLRFMPKSDLPARLQKDEGTATGEEPEPEPEPIPAPVHVVDIRRLVWGFVKHAPKLPNGGERVGEATANVEPWPHQVHAFQRLYGQWPPRLLIADEVGLGKTIQAGMLIRQAWLAEKAQRILVLAPAGVCKQWQLELREKLNLNWPIYDGDQLIWPRSPGRDGGLEEPIARDQWHRQPFIITSSHLMRRRDRVTELLEQSEPWDIVVVDEAHHARRRSPGLGGVRRPNRLLDLLEHLRSRAHALLLLTGTPMQVDPVEVWDLLALLGLPPEWGEENFLKFCSLVDQPNPSHDEMEFLAGMFRATELRLGAAGEQDVRRAGASTGLQARRILSALRDPAAVPRRQLDTAARTVALRLMRSQSPVRKMISRHTRDLLRRYYKAGKLATPIADRSIDDQFVRLSDDEARIYEAVENYISTTYNQASDKEKNAVGFVMTIYRRRLASSFAALRSTLEDHLDAIETGRPLKLQEAEDEVEAEPEGPEGDVLGVEEMTALEREALKTEEKGDIARLLADIRRLPPDTKAQRLEQELAKLPAAGYSQVMVFTQYTDTMDFLRDYLIGRTSLRIMCYSGRGGEICEKDGRWRRISREEAKQRFREGKADILLCTDAASEGLNFQFCGALINYEMPWNPMRVEQRIGRIDRLGQKHPIIRVINLHYQGTVEADVYMALRRRINLFESVVGRMQPILARLPGVISGHVFGHGSADPSERSRLVGDLERDAEVIRQSGFDLDSMLDADLEQPPQPPPKLNMNDLDMLIRHESALPAGLSVQRLQKGEYAYQAPGMQQAVRVTTRPDYFDEHSESVELWSPGSLAFPAPETIAPIDEITAAGVGSISEALSSHLR